MALPKTVLYHISQLLGTTEAIDRLTHFSYEFDDGAHQIIAHLKAKGMEPAMKTVVLEEPKIASKLQDTRRMSMMVMDSTKLNELFGLIHPKYVRQSDE